MAKNLTGNVFLEDSRHSAAIAKTCASIAASRRASILAATARSQDAWMLRTQRPHLGRHPLLRNTSRALSAAAPQGFALFRTSWSVI
ncbi:hypothetical protein [Rhodoblastus sp.]|uniref:hypothetical protein n=1 Tax=Rhodoblastus sp. TaxID=1962975 RepID=UPI0035B1CD88